MAAARTLRIGFLRYKPTNRLMCIRKQERPKTIFTTTNAVRTITTGGGIFRKKDEDDDKCSLFIPVPVKISTNPDDINIGEELTSSKLNKDDLVKLLNQFYKQKEVKELSAENGLDNKLYHQASISFRRWCMESEVLPADIHIVFSDVLQGAGHVDDLFPFFLRHARQIFPHLDCMDELKKISDLRLPANWYPEARAINRKIIFHAGPTNSGKTYHALERFMNAKSGVYCGPLKLLAVEVHEKCNTRGTPCDLVTGEERRFAKPDKSPASHVACTVEMTSVSTPYEVAVIDEIQMLKDPSRGWAWTRALLGAVAEEVHVCGEGAAVDLVKSICEQTGENVEVRKYKRLTPLHLEKTAVGTIDKIEAGDCIVCFNKNDIYTISRQLERKDRECAVIYGGLPPGTKLAQAKKFNDPNNPCKILVATDAIGMGLNLSIRRVIFYSTIKPTINEKGEKEMDTISTSQALQIGGRAGRYNPQFSEGFVTTFRNDDLNVLTTIMGRPVEIVETAGLHPTADQIELFAYHLPHATLSNLIDIFVSLCQVDSSFYFMCNVDTFKFLADMIQHVPLPLRARYVFCCAPINRKMPLVCTMFLKFARQYSRNEVLTFDWLCRNIGWPFAAPRNILDLLHLETVFDVLDLYLWLGYRFQDLFPDMAMVRDMQLELDSIIQQGVINIVNLLKATETVHSTGTAAHDEEYMELRRRKENFNKAQSFQYPEVTVPTLSPPTPGSSPDPDDDTFNSNIYANMVLDSKDAKQKLANALSGRRGQGRLTDRMIAEGLISADQIEQLQREWQQENQDRDKRVKAELNKQTRNTKRKK